MIRSKSESLLGLTESFFHGYLQHTRGASVHTVRAYRDTLKLFFLFLADQKRKSVADLTLHDIQSDAVLAFLDHVESRRGNSAATRNCRLAAVRSFVEHLLRQDVTRAGQYGRILAIRNKKAIRRVAVYLEPEEARAVVSAVDRRSQHGERDHALLLFLYNTGARVSEALAVRACDLRLERPRQVRLLGKGRKERICPLWSETASALHRIMRAGPAEGFLFRNSRGSPLTRDGVAYLLRKYVRIVAQQVPALRKRRLSPHVMRHSCAVALLQAGVDITVIRDYLGHVIGRHDKPIHHDQPPDETRGASLEAFWKRSGLDPTAPRKWRPSPKLLAFLESL
jgi:site-specific recombinase XerD